MKKLLSGNGGFTFLELLGVIVILGILVAIGMPMMHQTRLANAHSAAEQAVLGELNRARWTAINSGKGSTTVALANCTGAKCTTLQVLQGATVISSVDVGGHHVTVEGTNLPFDLDNRGFLATPGSPPSLLVESTAVTAQATVTITPLGKIQS